MHSDIRAPSGARLLRILRIARGAGDAAGRAPRLLDPCQGEGLEARVAPPGCVVAATLFCDEAAHLLRMASVKEALAEVEAGKLRAEVRPAHAELA